MYFKPIYAFETRLILQAFLEFQMLNTPFSIPPLNKPKGKQRFQPLDEFHQAVASNLSYGMQQSILIHISPLIVAFLSFPSFFSFFLVLCFVIFLRSFLYFSFVFIFYVFYFILFFILFIFFRLCFLYM